MVKLSTAQPARHPDPTVKANRVAYAIFSRPDLELAERYLSDFGLQRAALENDVLYMRGTQAAPYCYRVERHKRAGFIGLGLGVASRSDLQVLTRLPGASAIEPCPGPGGGERVRLTDPSGFRVEAVCWAQNAATALAHRAPLPTNTPESVQRVNATQRPPATPPEVIKLGHIALEVVDYQDTLAWYTQHFGLIPSDIQVLPDGSPAMTFTRLDLGDVPSDHHAVAFAQSFMPALNHVSFEVVDLDAVAMGHRVLQERGWKHVWGMGRHVLGSQIFDYWRDPWGDKHEHYADGDRFDNTVPAGVHPISAEAMAQWGQRLTPEFTRPHLNASAIWQLVRNLRRSPDLSLRKLVSMLRALR